MNFKSLLAFISQYDKFIICSHESPDGDAIGSEYAFLQCLKKMGKTAYIINNDPTPFNFQFIDVTNEVKHFINEKKLPKKLSEFGLFIVDTNDTNNIGVISTYILPKVCQCFIIDHHEGHTDDMKVAGSVSYKDASSTSEILYQFFMKSKIEIDLSMANALFMAIVYDTGSFIYPKTSSLTFKIAHHLVKIGVNPNEIYSNVYETDSIPSIILQSRVLSTLELMQNNHVAIQTMTKDILLSTKANYEEGRSIINIPLKAEDVKVSIFFKEDLKSVTRCSMRSKGDIDVCRIAQLFGGGGHKNAAGFKFDEDMKVVREKVLGQLKKYFEKDN
ncbi:MAG: bifunctional oligoribonuclease/PAP phosphatase NrnA [Spirochaetales bacterium]|nr:bifunctional oligoribonuclease/PAP phosphatase NrnA [Spirochaetales bacterium]